MAKNGKFSYLDLARQGVKELMGSKRSPRSKGSAASHGMSAVDRAAGYKPGDAPACGETGCYWEKRK